MATIDSYTEQAIAARIKADREPLSQRKQQYLRSAERWEMMAVQAEELKRKTLVNDEERRLRPYHQSLRERLR